MKILIQKDIVIPNSLQHHLQEPRHGGSLESKNLWMNEWMEKMQFVYTVEHYSAIKIMKSCNLQQHGQNPEGL